MIKNDNANNYTQSDKNGLTRNIRLIKERCMINFESRKNLNNKGCMIKYDYKKLLKIS